MKLRMGFLGFEVAATGRSVCYHCGHKVAMNNLRWQFWYHERRYHRWVHFRCARAMIDANPGEPWLVQCTTLLEQGVEGLTHDQTMDVHALLEELRSLRP